MSLRPKKNQREREIIQRLDNEIAQMRKKTFTFQSENPLSPFDPEVEDLSDLIHSGILPTIRKPTLH
ncbi:MAG: hypothetical protein HQL67_03900 [Magnetococcales bacterium]|nr:hypothetical protein [Magnetococcales bacterium]